MLLADWCFCPITKFTALYSEYIKYIKYQESKCVDDTEGIVARDPILNKVVRSNDLSLVSEEEASAYIKKYNNIVIESDKKGEKNGSGPNSANNSNTNSPSKNDVTNNGNDKKNNPVQEGRKKVSFF